MNKSATLTVFCTRDELTTWIIRLCSEKALSSISFCDSAEVGEVITNPTEFTLSNDTYRLFLFPGSNIPERALTLNDVEARLWGWVDIRPGGLHRTATGEKLLLSELGAEDFTHESVHPTQYIRWLKKHLKNEITSGVKGINIDTKGEAFYRDIYYTQSAINLQHSDVVWKQFVDGRVIFEPGL